jgi:hypothetical protein
LSKYFLFLKFCLEAKMLERFKFTVVFILIPVTNCLSQQLSHQVIVPFAELASDNKISCSQTVGETAVEIFNCFDHFLTQGFQQPAIKSSSDYIRDGIGVAVYPNPVSDYVYIELWGESSMSFKIDIINITGNIVFSETKAFSDKFWYKEPQNVDDLIRGFYLIRITSKNPMMNRSFKIEKI